jgi:hypothetical protein
MAKEWKQEPGVFYGLEITILAILLTRRCGFEWMEPRR